MDIALLLEKEFEIQLNEFMAVFFGYHYVFAIRFEFIYDFVTKHF